MCLARVCHLISIYIIIRKFYTLPLVAVVHVRSRTEISRPFFDDRQNCLHLKEGFPSLVAYSPAWYLRLLVHVK